MPAATTNNKRINPLFFIGWRLPFAFEANRVLTVAARYLFPTIDEAHPDSEEPLQGLAAHDGAPPGRQCDATFEPDESGRRQDQADPIPIKPDKRQSRFVHHRSV